MIIQTKEMENSDELKNCTNCGKVFPENKIDLHEAYCCRNFRRCELCGVMVDRHEIEEHKKEAHEEKTCDYCALKYEVSKEEHLLTCNEKPEYCPYCENNFPSSGISKHKESCGARTRNCVICNKPVLLRELDSHLVRCTNRQERRESSQEQRVNQRAQNLYRQNSTNEIIHKNPDKSPKNQLPKPRNYPNVVKVIPPEKIKPQIDPIPISIKLTLQKKKSMPSKQKVSHHQITPENSKR